uniref:FBA_1 domain-containing protein n=1 Tax=Panagrellus redivivus TaxID=6233 RepID=A0A7E4UT40_PANRE
MNGIQFNGWDLLQRDDSFDWVDSFTTLVEDPHWTDIEVQLADDSVSTVFVFRKGYIPCWECGLYNCKIYIDVAKTEMETVCRQLHGHPLMQNVKVVGLYYNKKKECLRFWVIGGDIDIPPIIELIQRDIREYAWVRNVSDPFWVSSKTMLPFRDNTRLPIERIGLDRTDPELFQIKISVPNYTINFETTCRLRNYIVARQHFTLPLVSAEFKAKPFLLTFLVDCRRRCEIYQKYEVAEVMILITATWKRNIVKITQSMTVNALITKNDAEKTMICEL